MERADVGMDQLQFAVERNLAEPAVYSEAGVIYQNVDILSVERKVLVKVKRVLLARKVDCDHADADIFDLIPELVKLIGAARADNQIIAKLSQIIGKFPADTRACACD